MKTSSRRRAAGFTLLEVLAAVLVLGLVYTVLARAAIVGLRSEGLDRRRAEASLVADRELALLESLLQLPDAIESGVTTRELDPYRITSEVIPEDVLALLPAPVDEEGTNEEDDEIATLLVDDEGESRVLRIRVSVEWDEGLETASVERITWAFDTSELAALFPLEGEASEGEGEGEEEGETGAAGESDQAAEIRRMMQQLEGGR